MSMLSDVQKMIALGDDEQARQALNRAKRLLSAEWVDPFHAALAIGR